MTEPAIEHLSKRPSRLARWLAWCFSTLGFVCFALLVFLPVHMRIEKGDNDVAVLKPALLDSLSWVFGSGLAFIAIAAVVQGLRHRFGAVALLIVADAAVGFFAFMSLAIRQMYGLNINDQTTLPDGSRYVVVSSWVPSDLTITLAREPSSTLLFIHLSPIGSTLISAPWNCPLLVRPATVNPNQRTVFFSLRDASMLAFFYGDNECALAYDTRGGKFYDTDAVAQLSPFLLLDGGLAPYRPDLQSIINAHAADNDHPYPPSDDTRKEAARLLERTGPGQQTIQ
jgi:hypothetical protein